MANNESLYELAFVLLGELDSGKTVDVDETRQKIQDGTIFDWLRGQVPVMQKPRFANLETSEMIQKLQTMEQTISASDPGISRNGLVLLMRYCIEDGYLSPAI